MSTPDPDYIPRYAAGDDMDRLHRPRQRSSPPGPFFWLLVFLLSIAFASGKISLPRPAPVIPIDSASPTAEPQLLIDNLAAGDLTDDGHVFLNGTVSSVNTSVSGVVLTLKVFAGNVVVYTEDQIITRIPQNVSMDFTYDVPIIDSLNEKGFPPEKTSVSYRVSVKGWQTH